MTMPIKDVFGQKKLLQVFTPVAGKTAKLTVPAGGNVVWTVPAGTKVFQFQPTCGVKVTYNANTDGLTYDASVRSDCLGVDSATTSIKFTDTGSGGGTVVIEAM